MDIRSERGHLTWGGADAVRLAEKFGTPLYVISEEMIRGRIGAVRKGFLERHRNTRAAYASKAFLTQAMTRIVDEEGLYLDVVSGGEIHTASAAGFPMERVIFHGNAKSRAELDYAIGQGVGRFVIDGLMELESLCELAGGKGAVVPILLRISPGIDTHTHKHIRTGGLDSKFGMPIKGDELESAIKTALESACLSLEGLHFHLGSQITEPDSHVLAAEALVSRLDELRTDLGYTPRELNIGGGFGVAFAPDEEAVDIREFLDPVMKILDDYFANQGTIRPLVCIEPGRWVVSEAGITLYTVETIKDIPEVVTYVAVDGGMADNPRPALYDAKYSVLLANRMDDPPEITATVVGRCCESGDVIARDARLPHCRPGDILAVLSTGAYNHSMASNYNRLPRPAVVLVSGGQPEVVVRRETWDDLIRLERIPEHLRKR